MADKNSGKMVMFEGKRIRSVQHEGAWWFVIVDVVAALTDSADPAQYLKKMRSRDPELAGLFKGGGNLYPPFCWRHLPPVGRRRCTATAIRAACSR